MNGDWKYVALALNTWGNLRACTPAELPVAPIGKSTGFLLVYDTLEALRKEYPHSDYMTIMPVPKPQPQEGGEHGEKAS
jgi:hypothetical protein